MKTTHRLRLPNRLRRKSRTVRAICVASIAAFCTTHAADVISTWTGAIDGNWSVNGNWTNAPVSGGFPNNGNGGVATYDAILDNGGTITLGQNITIQKFNLISGTLTGSLNLTTNELVTWTGGAMGGSGATNANGGMTINSTGVFLGLDTRTLNNAVGQTATWTGDATFGGGIAFANGAVFNNNGTFLAQGDQGFTDFGGGGTFNNAGTFTRNTGTGTLTVGGNIVFNNTGTVNVQTGTLVLQGGDGGSTTGDFAISNGATLDFQGGNFDLTAAANITGAGTAQFSGATVNLLSSSASNILITGGTANFNGTTAATTIVMNGGTLGGTGALNATGNLTWTGGTMTGSGTTSAAGLASTISTANSPILGRVLTNTGTMTFSSIDNTTPLYFGPDQFGLPGVLTNNGTFNVTAGGDFASYWGNAGHAINNAGTWNVSGAGTTSIVNAGIAFNNTGTVNVLSGTLALAGGDSGSTTGDFAISNGATLDFQGGNFDLTAAANITGAGTAQFSGATVNLLSSSASNILITGGTANFNGTTAATTIVMNGGTLGGTGALNATGNLTWTGGTMTGSGTTSAAGLASTISTANSPILGRVLTNTGTMTFSSIDNTTPLYFGPDQFGLPGVLTNNGTFNVTAGGDFASYWGNAGHAINNAGTWNVSGAGTTSIVNAGIAFNNTGTVNVLSGTLALAGGDSGSTTGDFAISNGATLDFQGGNFDLTAAANITGAGTAQFSGATVNLLSSSASNILITGGTANFNGTTAATTIVMNGGTLGGTGALNATGNLTWTGGTMTGSGTTSAAGLASTISTANSPILGRVLTNTGTMTFSSIDNTTPLYFGPDQFGLPGVLTNNGTFNVTAGGDFASYWGNAGHAINNAGTWNVSGAGTTSIVNAGIAFNNTGTVNVLSGTLNLSGDGESTGSFAISSGAALTFNSGTYLLDNGASFTGAGSATVVSGTVNAGNGAADVITAQTFGQDGGILAGLGQLNVGNFAWTGGTMTGSGATSAAGLASTISTANAPILGRVLTNTGTMTFSSIDNTTPLYFGPDQFGLPGVLTNNGTFNVTAGGDFVPYWGNAGHAINNAGTWNVSGAGTVSYVDFGIAFNNTGTVNVNSGTFALQGTDVTQYASDTLTGGTWRVFAGSALNLPSTGTGVVTNQADITLSGAGSVWTAGAANSTIESTLTSNSGALRVLANRDYTNTSALNNSGVLELGGGTFAAPGLTNTSTGEIFGFGTVSVRPTNSGLIRSAGGTLAFANGIQGPGGTVRVDTGSTLNLSGGASNSSAAFLIHNGTTAGSLNLGTNNFTVGNDYTNASFGTGNTFNPRANVSGSGQILATGGIAQTVTGDVTNGATGTPTLTSFGNVHVGDVVTKNYRIANVGASGSNLRGAVQTSVNGGNITDPRLSGAGVTAGNFGPLAPGANTGDLAVTFTATTAGPITGQAVRILNNFDNVGDQTLAIGGGAAYRYAVAALGTLNFGNVLVGSSQTLFLSVSNTAFAGDGFSEGLDAALGGFSGASAGLLSNTGGSITNLAAGANDSTTLAVTLNTSAAGTVTASVQVLLNSNGAGTSGLGVTALPSQPVAISGLIEASVGNLARASDATPNPVDLGNVRVGAAAPSRTLTISNLAVGPAEGLNATISTATPGLTATGSFTGLAPGETNNTSLVVSMNTATAGSRNGTAAVTRVSDGSFNSGVTTPLGDESIDVTGAVYLPAIANTLATPINLGSARIGGTLSSAIGVTNVAPNTGGFTETLGATVTGTTNGATTSGSVSGLTQGASSNAISAGFSTATAGPKSGSATLGFTSSAINGSGLGTIGAGSQTVDLTGAVYQPAVANTLATPINLGNVRVGGTLSSAIGVTNAAPDTGGFTETLGATVTGTTSGVTTSGSVSGLAQGASSSAITAGFDTTTAGAKSGSATLGFTSSAINGSGLGTIGVGSQTVDLTGGVYRLAEATLGTLNFGSVLVGSSQTRFLSVSNTAFPDVFSEGLDAALGGFSGASAALLSNTGGFITDLAAGANDSTTLAVTLNTSAAGTVTASVQVLLGSNGATTSGLGVLALPSQPVAISGLIEASVGNLASASVAATPDPLDLGNVRVGAAAPSRAVTISNLAVGPAEGLNATISTATPGLTATGSFTSLAPGATNNTSLVVSMNTATAGSRNGTATVAPVSDGSFNSGVPTPLSDQTINVTGAVYQPAAASTLATPVNLGTLRTGTVVNTTLPITNTAPATGGFTETLAADFGTTSPGLTGSGSASGVGAGDSSNALSVQFTAGAPGAFSGSALVNFTSEAAAGSGLSDLPLASQSVDFLATVNALAVFSLANLSGYSIVVTGPNTAMLDFGTIPSIAALNAAFTLSNGAVSPSDSLLGSFNVAGLAGSPFSFAGATDFDLNAGEGNPFSVQFDPATAGNYSATFGVNFASHNASQSDLALGSYTITVKGRVEGGNPVPDSPISLFAALTLLGTCALGHRFRRAGKSA